jgi:predicted DNA-binding transcriptional regulator YafY
MGPMGQTTGRVLRLLTLLQGRRVWTSVELSERLHVDARTIRRDVERLRELGYAIDASAGPGGGYRLGAGNATPPLLLDDEEAIAVAAALGAAAGVVSGADEVALRVLVKLNQLLPPRLRHRLSALEAMTVSLGNRPMTDPHVLMQIATACQDRVVLDFTYRNRRGDVSERCVEPERLVHAGRVWYLMAWDRSREEWRTFRVDRVNATVPLVRGERFANRTPPEDPAAFVARSIASMPNSCVAHVKLAAPAEQVARHAPPWIGVPEPIDEDSCQLTFGAETVEMLAAHIIHVGVDFEVLGPPEIIEPLMGIVRRMEAGLGARMPQLSADTLMTAEGAGGSSSGFGQQATIQT